MALPILGASEGAWGTALNNFLGGADGAGVPTIPNNRIPYLSGGNHTSSANLTFDGTTLTIPAAVVTASAALTITPAAGTNLNINLSTTGDLAVNTNQFYVDTSAARVGILTATPSQSLDVNGNGIFSVASAYVGIGASSLNSVSSRLQIRYDGATTGVTAANANSIRLVQDGGNNVMTSLQFGQGNTNDSNITALIGALQTSIASNGLSDLVFALKNAATDADVTERMRITSVGNVKIAGTAARATTEGTNHLDIFDGTAPVGTLAAGISLYSTAGELRVMDSGGTATLLSASDKSILAFSDPSWMPWAFPKENSYTGERWEVNMGKLIAWAETLSGQKFAERKLLLVKLDWDADQEKMRLEQGKQILAAQNQVAELDKQIAAESNPAKKTELTLRRDSIKVPAAYMKVGPPIWMVKRGVKSAIVEA